MPAARDLLVTKVAAMWEKYMSTVRTGGTPEQRRFACDQAVKADDKLAVHDEGVRSKTSRERKARAGSGK